MAARKKKTDVSVAAPEAAGLSQARLRQLLDYEPETGIFRWRYYRSSNAPAGKIAGSKHNAGYLTIRIDYRPYLCHRLAWLWVNGHFPSNQIDHKNGDRQDNRIVNLRACSNAENCQNVRPHHDGSSGHVGVFWSRKAQRWQAAIGVAGKIIYLGRYTDKNKAIAAYVCAKNRFHSFQCAA